MKNVQLVIEVSEECLSQDPKYCENFDTMDKCFFMLDKGDWEHDGDYHCNYYNTKLYYDNSGQFLKCKQCLERDTIDEV